MVVVEGLEFTEELLGRVRVEVEDHPGISRSALSRQVCQWAGWKSANGRWREMSCRLALRELERRGYVALPTPKRRLPPQGRCRKRYEGPPDSFPELRGRVDEIEGIELIEVSAASPELSALWNRLLNRHHYLGAGPLVGAQLRYLVRSRAGWLGALAFSAAARQVECRDQWVGWTASQRRSTRQRVVCNSRLVIVPSVQVKNLASRVLALACRR